MYLDVKDEKEVIVCTVGKTVLLYDAKCLKDLHNMLKEQGDWMELGSADEQKEAKEALLRLGDVLKTILLADGMA